MSANGKRIAFIVNALAGKELIGGNADTSSIHTVLMKPEFGGCSQESPPPIYGCPTPEAFTKALRDLLRNWDPSNQLILYFSGHGDIQNGLYCLQFGDEKRDDLPFGAILDQLTIKRVTRAVIILDTCRSGGAIGIKGLDDGPAIQLPKSEELPQGIAILASSRKSQFSHELEDRTASVFTRLICEAIESGLGGQATADGLIGVSDLISFIRAQLKTARYAKYAQDPVYEVSQADRTIWVAKNTSRQPATLSETVEPRRDVVHTVEELCRVAQTLVPSRRPCFGATLDELDWDLVEQYARAVKVDPSGRGRSNLATAIGLYVPLASSVSETLHNAAVICFCRMPEKYISQARSTFLVGDIGSRQFVNQIVTGPLTRQLEQLVQLTKSELRLGISTFGDGALRRDESEIPETVIRELLSNALAHRDYTAGGNVQIHVTSKFIEVRSPGTFPSSISWNDFIQLKARNSCPPDPVVTMYTTLLRGSEGVGRGFITFRDFIARNGTESMTCEVLPGPTTCVRITRPDILSPTSSPCVFISYSHDSDEHRGRVLGFSERLRADGIETILDRYVEGGSPPEGWPRWMLNCLEKATHVLCVCTETYDRRFRGLEVPGKGKGADWEGAVITQSLYDARGVSTKFIPVLFAHTEAPYVPEPLRGHTFYFVDSDAGYQALYDALLNQSGVVPGPVSSLKRKPRATGQPLSFPPSPAAEADNTKSNVTRKIARTQLDKHVPRVLFGRETELEALDAAWTKRALNVYTLVAWGGAGKTSLVFHWVQTRFAATGWPGVERYFDWSFYSQGTGESRQTSADLFIAKALAFFGDPDPTVGSPYERGERLAGLIRRHRTLLILDGIEPLQYPPNDPQAGWLKDQALDALLRELAADNPGLVVITTREHLTNVEGYVSTQEQKLDKLDNLSAVALLRHLQVVGTDEELQTAWQDAGGHALTLSLLGRFIADAFDDRDIRHHREVKFEAADQEHQGRSAFKVMVAYERWLQSAGSERQRELAVLRLTGLFDRPIAKGCLQALRAEPAIPGLTDVLVTLTEQQWNIAVTRLSQVDLLSVSTDAIDAHPLIREYFAAQLQRDQPEAFQAAHARLFNYLCANTPHRPDGLDGLAPLYEAVTHGCLAGRHQEACDKVYIDRILRGTGSEGFYSTRKVGAIGANLAAVAAFFDEPWRQLSPNLTSADQAWLLNEAAFHLRALGRLTEALQPMRAGLEMLVRQKDWKSAAISASNLSDLEVTLARLPDAVTDARQSMTHADQSGDNYLRLALRNTAAEAMHQSGQRAEAGALFTQAERMQQESQPQFDLLYSLRGFQYCDWLLAPAEQAAWQHLLDQPVSNSKSQISDGLAEVECRATTTLAWVTPQNWLLDIALDHLTIARVALIRAILANPLPQPTLDLPHVTAAVDGLRAAGHMDGLPRGLLTAALYHFVRGEHALALKHLAEAQQIAERGPMPLFLADIHLTRARLAASVKREGGRMDVDANAELAQAATLIRTHGYGRRYQELADAEAAIGGSR